MNNHLKFKTGASVFEVRGIPAMRQALPLALQHVVAMIVGCVTPDVYKRQDHIYCYSSFEFNLIFMV